VRSEVAARYSSTSMRISMSHFSYSEIQFGTQVNDFVMAVSCVPASNVHERAGNPSRPHTCAKKRVYIHGPVAVCGKRGCKMERLSLFSSCFVVVRVGSCDKDYWTPKRHVCNNRGSDLCSC
jgi:hypothetical protein